MSRTAENVGILIESVANGSLAQQSGIRSGDRLVAINGEMVRDLIDYAYLAFDDDPEMEVVGFDGKHRLVHLATAAGESLGLSFAAPKPKRCGNNCLFCFVHQLPKGLRKPLYVKDEDYRLSFLQGTYVTLSNLKNLNCNGSYPNGCHRCISRFTPRNRCCGSDCWGEPAFRRFWNS